jgi:hypothetical protein
MGSMVTPIPFDEDAVSDISISCDNEFMELRETLRREVISPKPFGFRDVFLSMLDRISNLLMQNPHARSRLLQI